MNKILIANSHPEGHDDSLYQLTLADANRMLPILRSDHFKLITIHPTQPTNPKDLRFLVQLTRLLKTDGQVVIQGQADQSLLTLLKTLNLFEGAVDADRRVFLKTKPAVEEGKKEEKLAIGFKANQAQEEIDESALLQGEGLEIGKKKAEKCETKPRACANCNCGRKDTETVVSKEQLVAGINEGKPVSGCGKCFLGDSFRCGTCPYKGLPAFKPGDKLKLVEEGGVVVEEAATFVSASGKVKLEI